MPLPRWWRVAAALQWVFPKYFRHRDAVTPVLFCGARRSRGGGTCANMFSPRGALLAAALGCHPSAACFPRSSRRAARRGARRACRSAPRPPAARLAPAPPTRLAPAPRRPRIRRPTPGCRRSLPGAACPELMPAPPAPPVRRTRQTTASTRARPGGAPCTGSAAARNTRRRPAALLAARRRTSFPARRRRPCSRARRL